mmetsp:Transcript_71091/g.199414  ORF Transcript_71091/g.199414 Transcript_71091/m.199414 type:complete len:240 (-) Transcript_71091:278-997(-)
MALKIATASPGSFHCPQDVVNSERRKVPLEFTSKALNAASEFLNFDINCTAKSWSKFVSSPSVLRFPMEAAAFQFVDVRPKAALAAEVSADVACGKCFAFRCCCINSLTRMDTSSCAPMSERSQASKPSCVRAQRSQTSKSWSRTSHFGRAWQAACKAVQPRRSWKSGLALACSSARTVWSSRCAAASISRRPWSTSGGRASAGGHIQKPGLASLGGPPGNHSSIMSQPASLRRDDLTW